MPAFDLIIFDCDGVLVDSEQLAMRVLLKTIEREGIVLDPAAAFRDFLGRSLASISASLVDSHGKHLGDAALEDMRRDLYDLYRSELRPSPNIREALETIGIPFCVASSSHVERIRLSLELTGLLPFFGDRIFSASMVDRGKPAPDLFLHAASAMGVPPERCLVIEDSPAGIAAAQAAGMTVFAYVGGSHIAPSGVMPALEALGPSHILTAMSALPAAIARWDHLVVGVDVGTLSARAAVFTATGAMVGRAEKSIDLRRVGADRGEHDSEQVWSAVCEAVRAAVAVARIDVKRVVGIAFDATCSLVIRDGDGSPLAVSADSDTRWDTISWFDHRAMAEARDCTATGHRILDFAGGVMSPEMEMPKLMWLKRHRPEMWARMGYAFDLADFLSWRATGSTARSQSTLTSKWNYLAHDEGWQPDFLDAVGLDDAIAQCALPSSATPVGAPIGPLTSDAATALGLTTACVVAAGLVDAHAGALGLLGALALRPDDLHHHPVLIAGTSNSILVLSTDPRPLRGIWGPYWGAVLPGIWLSEGGQSAAGALLDHLIRWYTGEDASAATHARVVARIRELQSAEGANLAPDIHILPDFHGNRSPLADPEARGMITGLTLDASFDALCRLYWRTSVALGLGLRQILKTYAAAGYGTGTMAVAGGHTRNDVLMEAYADATGATLHWSDTDDSVLLGAAIAAAAPLYAGIAEAAATMGTERGQRTRVPASPPRFDDDYAVMLEMQTARTRRS